MKTMQLHIHILICASTLGMISSALASDAAAQQPAAIMTLGRHLLGAGLEYPINRRLHVAARAEGFPLHVRSAWGIGIRSDVVADTVAQIYLTVLGGQTKCTPATETGGCSSSWKSALAMLGGADITLDDRRRWSAGIEGGYWFASGAPDDLSHLAFAATLRWRPLR